MCGGGGLLALAFFFGAFVFEAAVVVVVDCTGIEELSGLSMLGTADWSAGKFTIAQTPDHVFKHSPSLENIYFHPQGSTIYYHYPDVAEQAYTYRKKAQG